MIVLCKNITASKRHIVKVLKHRECVIVICV
jgi:hypothetical protein